MEYGSIEREIFVDAAPDVVFDVLSRPEHVREWWPDVARYDLSPGSTGEIVFGAAGADAAAVAITVIEVDPPRRYVFRWTHPVGEAASPTNSLLVTFDLIPSRDGTLLTMTETGFREQDWEAAVLEEQYRDHESGWDYYLPRLHDYATSVGARS